MANAHLSTLGARARATALLDPGSAHSIALTDAVSTSPWLAAQNIVPPPGDGVAIVYGYRRGRPTLSIATEPTLLGGTLGEVGGALVASALAQVHRWVSAMNPGDPRLGVPPQVLMWLDGGGVRVHEGQAALLAAADVLQAMVQLRHLAHLVAILPGPRGCYGAWALVAGLCHNRIAVRGSRLGLSGPRVIAELGPNAGFRHDDDAAVAAMHGSRARLSLGLIDAEIDDTPEALATALDALPHNAMQSRQIASMPPTHTPEDLGLSAMPAGSAQNPASRLMAALAPDSNLPCAADGTVLLQQTRLGHNPTWLLATSGGRLGPLGEPLGLRQARALARQAEMLLTQTPTDPSPRPVLVLLVDAPGQAMAVADETAGLHQALSDLRRSYAALTDAGWAVLALLLGQGVSGAFLCHGLSAQRLLCLGGPHVRIKAMAGPGIAAVTRRVGREAWQPTRSDAVDPRNDDRLTFAHLGGIDSVCDLTADEACTPAGAAALRLLLEQQIALCPAPPWASPAPRNAKSRPATANVWALMATTHQGKDHPWGS